MPNGTRVYLTQRPDRADADSVTAFLEDKVPIVRFCFCDDYVEPPKEEYNSTPWHWLPWVPGKNIPIENVFAFISMMSRYIKEERPIWLHCDSSSMRAPTYFGLFLQAVYPNEVVDICDKMVVSDNSEYEYAKYSCALAYSDVSLKQDPGIRELIDAWKSGGEKQAYDFYMGYNCKI